MRLIAALVCTAVLLSAAVVSATETEASDCSTWDTATGTAGTCEIQGSTTGIGAGAFEPTIGVRPNGDVFYTTTPASGVAIGWRAGMHRQVAGESTWTDVQPAVGPFSLPAETNDPFGYTDPGTGRVFSFHMAPILTCSIMSFSDDGGETWTTPPVGCGPSGAWDHQTIVAAKPVPPTVTVGYPNVLVQCVNSVYAEMCARSLDGGLTWGTGYPVYANEYIVQTCGTQTGHLHADADGVIYLPTSQCGDKATVYVSEDSGLTWTERVIDDRDMPFKDPAIDTDGAGNLHAVWLDADFHLLYAMSADKGVTWTTPVPVTAPEVYGTFPALSAGDEGKVVIAFPGTDDLPEGLDTEFSDEYPQNNVAWDAFLAIATDATDGTPTFNVVNASQGDPLERGMSCTNRCAYQVDFIDVSLTPDGGIVAAMVDGCDSAECISGQAGNNVNYNGAGVGQAVLVTADVDLCADTCHAFAPDGAVAPAPAWATASRVAAQQDTYLAADHLGLAKIQALSAARTAAIQALRR